jgi:hypothetical protein
MLMGGSARTSRSNLTVTNVGKLRGQSIALDIDLPARGCFRVRSEMLFNSSTGRGVVI